MTMTLTQVLLQQKELLLFGHQVSDFYLRGDLGLGLDPDGPITFAWVHGFKTTSGPRETLAEPLLLSVHGPGSTPDPEAAPGERCWRVYRDEGAVRVVPSRGRYGEWLGLDAPAPG